MKKEKSEKKIVGLLLVHVCNMGSFCKCCSTMRLGRPGTPSRGDPWHTTFPHSWHFHATISVDFWNSILTDDCCTKKYLWKSFNISEQTRKKCKPIDSLFLTLLNLKVSYTEKARLFSFSGICFLFFSHTWKLILNVHSLEGRLS